jgi:O-antigen/teichoic acid export membrane protein
MMLTQLVNSGLGAVYWIAAARIFAPNEIGLATALISAMTLSSLVANVGAGTALVELLPGAKNEDDWSKTVLAALVASGAVALAVGGTAAVLLPLLAHNLRSLSASPWTPAAFVVGVLFWTLTTVLDLAFVAERKAGYSLTRNAAFSLGKIPLVLVPLVASGARGEILFATWSLAAAATFILGVTFLLPRSGRRLRIRLEGLPGELRRILGSLAGHHAVNLTAAATIYALPLLVTVRLSTTANAYFYVTWMVAGVFLVVSPSVASALFAEGSNAPNELARQLKTAALVIVSFVLPLGALLVAVGDRVLSIFGTSYGSHGYVLLLIIIAGALPDAATTLFVALLRVRRRLREAAALNTGIAAVTLILTWVLLPRFGITGAGVAWLIAQVAGTAVAASIGLTRHPVPAGTRKAAGRA